MAIIPPRNNQAGFSLVETVLTAVLVVLVFVGFGAVFFRVTRNVESLNERAAQNGEAALLAEKLTLDLQRAGEGMTFSAKSSFSGESALSFEPNSEYFVGSDHVTRLERGDSLLLSSLLWRGRGELKFRGSVFSVSIRDTRDSLKFRSIVSQSRYLSIVEDGADVYEQMTRSSESSFVIKVESVMEAGAERCRTSYIMDGNPIYTSSMLCIENAVEVAVWLPEQTSLTGLKLIGSELAYRGDGAAPVRYPLLPLFRGSRLNSFVVSDDRGFMVLSGSGSMFLGADSSFYPAVDQDIQLLDPIDVQPGDVLFVCDFANGRSLLLDVTNSDGVTVNVRPRTIRYDDTPIDIGGGKDGGSDSFSDLSSAEEDFSGFNFTAGTRIVKLSPPVQYKISSKDATPGLYRRAGSGPWELLAPNVENFLFAERSPSGSANYETSLDVYGEGVENARTAFPVRVSVSPRALNRTFDTR